MGKEGVVAPNAPTGPTSHPQRNEARIAPTHCATTYGMTSDERNRPTDQNPRVTAGLMCAPPRCPLDATISVTARPNARATLVCPKACVRAEVLTAPGPIATRGNVPSNSATHRRASDAMLYAATSDVPPD